MTTVGFLGLGIMGSRMAANLRRAIPFVRLKISCKGELDIAFIYRLSGFAAFRRRD